MAALLNPSLGQEIVEPDGTLGGYRLSLAVSSSQAQQFLDFFESLRELMHEIRLELVAVRLGIQEQWNEGNAQQIDLREMAQTFMDNSDSQEP